MNRMFSPKTLRQLIIPLIIEQTLSLSIGVFDTAMVASVGEAAVSGVSLVDSVNLLILNLFTAFTTGGAIVACQYLGRRDIKNANHAAKQLLIAVIFFSFGLMTVCLTLNGPILSLFFNQIEPDVMQNARVYFYLTAMSYPFIALFNGSAALLRGMGNTKAAMVNAMIMNILHLLGNALFIYGFKMGVAGAALSTLLSRLIAAIAMMWMLRNPMFPIHIRSYSLRSIDFSMIRRILRIGIPNGLENSLFQFGRIIVTSLVALQGTAGIAANAVANSISNIAVIPASAIGLTMLTVVAQCVGAKQHDQAAGYAKKLILITYGALLLLNLVLIPLLRPIISQYQISDASASLAHMLLVLHSIFAILLYPTSFTLPNALRASGDVRFPMLISILSMFICRIGLSYLLVHVFSMGILSIWVAMFSDWAVRSICFAWRWHSGRWRSMAVV